MKIIIGTDICVIVFEDKHLADEAVVAVEKEIHRDVSIDEKHSAAVHSEDVGRFTPPEKV